MVRLTLSFFVFLSFVSTALTIANAFFLKKQFYPSVVYLTKSNTSMAVLYFQAAVLSYLIFSLLRLIFFGQLRVAEVEHAQERVWHAVMETCLAFTVFRDDFSPKFVVQFVVLFFVKAFHWLAEDRVDYMERSPVISLLFHTRIMGILSLVSAVDSYFISYAFFTTLMRGASAQVVFGFEYAILLTVVAHIAIKYILHIHDLRSAHPWESKAVYMLYAELFVNFLRCALYMVFGIVMIKIHTFPLFAIRPFYLTLRAFQKAINDVVLSRRAINAMNNLFPLATAQELADGDNTCIICREEMTVESGAKKLPCNHIFHPNCLRSWFQRQQTCPTCRTDVLANRQGASAAAGAAAAQRAAFGGIIPANQNNFGQAPNFFNPNFGGFHFGGNFGQFMAPPFLQNQQQQQQQQQPNGQPNAGAAGQQQPQQGGQQPGTPAAAAGAGINDNNNNILNNNNNGLGPQPAHHLPHPMFGGGGGFMPFNNMFPMAFPPPFPPPPAFFGAAPAFPRFEPAQAGGGAQAQPDASTSQAGGTATTSSTTSATATASATVGADAADSSAPPQQPTTAQTSAPQQLPFTMPPSPFMFAGPPPFPQPPTFSGFSDAEISEMEGRERGAVEARVQALRNISVLLDAAMLQFQQYLSIAAASSSTPAFSSPFNVSTTPGASAGGASTSAASRPSAQQTPTTPAAKTSTPEAAASPSRLSNGGIAAAASSSAASGAASEISDEVRRRRLEKFGATAAANDGDEV